MKEPENNDTFPLPEYEGRLARLRAAMAEGGICFPGEASFGADMQTHGALTDSGDRV